MKPLEQLAKFSRQMTLRPGVAILRVAAAVKRTETVTIDGTIFEADFQPLVQNAVGAGHTRIDLSAAGSIAAALGTLTLSGNAVAAETVTINGRVYTWRSSVSTVANEVLVGADAAHSILNLIAAINADPTQAGTAYGALTTVNADVTAAGTSSTCVVTAILKGTGGNALATTETMTNGAWGASTLASGADASASDFTTAFVAAIATVAIGIQAIRISANEVLVYSNKRAKAGVAVSETLTGSNNAWDRANLSGGGTGSEDDLLLVGLVSRAVLAGEVALGDMHFMFKYPPTMCIVQVRTAAGVTKAWDGVPTISGNRVTLDNSGATDWAATDVVTLLVG